MGVDESTRTALAELRRRFAALYGERLVRMVLYGSRARGDGEPASDIDVLVVLKGPVSPGDEIARTGGIVADLSLEFDEVISCVFMDEERFNSRGGPLLRNVRKEGIAVWMSACLVAFLAAVTACETRPKGGPGPSAADVVVELSADGRAGVGGEAVTMDEFLVMLREKTERCPRDADGLPVISVEISAHSECEYRYVQNAMLAGVSAYIWRLRWEMTGRRLEVNLPRVDGTVHWNEFEVVEITELETGTVDPGPLVIDGIDIGETELDAGRDGCCVDERPELRVKLYWANAKGQVIYSATEPTPPTSWRRAPLSAEGAHIVIRVGTMECTDFDKLGGRLVELLQRCPDLVVVIDARQKVPFGWVFDTLETCRKAGVKEVQFPPPPIESGGGEDWWHMWLGDRPATAPPPSPPPRHAP